MEALVIIGAGLVLFLVVRTVARWAVRRDIARCEQRRAERERETLARYRSHTTPGRRAATSESSTPSTSSVWDAFAPAPRDADPVPAVPHVYSTPSLHGGGGSFAGAGASGGGDAPSCGGSDYSGGSSSSSDSGSSCSSSSGSD